MKITDTYEKIVGLDRCGYLGHSDLGYFLGRQFVRFMPSSHSLLDMAKMSAEILSTAILGYAASQSCSEG